MQNIAIMGGTFDPIHYGHLTIAQCAYHHFDLDKVIFIPSGMPPHKADRKVASAVDRYNMTRLAVENNPHFTVSSYEIDKAGFSYTVDTIKYFKGIYYDSKLYFIVGSDALLEMHKWKSPDEIFEMCEVISATRPGYELRKSDLGTLDCFLNKINLFEVPALDISSTDIRQRIIDKRPIRYLLPDNVIDYINVNNLYL